MTTCCLDNTTVSVTLQRIMRLVILLFYVLPWHIVWLEG